MLNLSNYANPTGAIDPQKLNDAVEEIALEQHCKSVYASTHLMFNRVTGEVKEMNCRSWRCPKHRSKWLYKWRIVVSRDIEAHPVDRLVTLTLSEACTPPQLVLARQLLCRQLRKEFTDFEYLAVLEFTTKTRLPHLHMLVRSPFLPQIELSNYWAAATTAAGISPSPIVYVERPRSQAAAAQYALSYALSGHVKNQDIPDNWRGRKITYSRGFFKSGSVYSIWSDWLKEQFGEDSRHNWEVIPTIAGRPITPLVLA